MNSHPLVSIIMPSYNHAEYIQEAVDSVFKQTYTHWELIIVDDGSKDSTHEILRLNYSSDDRIKLVLHPKNRGQSFVLNEGIELAQGKYISFFTSDDWYLPDKLEQQVNKFAELDDNYGVVYSAGLRYFEDTKQTLEVSTNKGMRRGWIFKDLLLEPFFVYPITPLFKKEIFNDIKFDERYLAQGEAIFFDIALRWKFDYVEKPLVVMRDHSRNTGKMIDEMLRDNVIYREYLFSLPNFPVELKKYKGIIIGKIYRMSGLTYIKIHQQNKKGVTCLLKSINYYPKYLLDYKVIGGLVLGIIKICRFRLVKLIK